MCERTNFDAANVSSRVCGYCNDLMFVLFIYLFVCLQSVPRVCMDRSVSSSVCVRTMDTVTLSMESVIVLLDGWDNSVIEVRIVLN